MLTTLIYIRIMWKLLLIKLNVVCYHVCWIQGICSLINGSAITATPGTHRTLAGLRPHPAILMSRALTDWWLGFLWSKWCVLNWIATWWSLGDDGCSSATIRYWSGWAPTHIYKEKKTNSYLLRIWESFTKSCVTRSWPHISTLLCSQKGHSLVIVYLMLYSFVDTCTVCFNSARRCKVEMLAEARTYSIFLT